MNSNFIFLSIVVSALVANFSFADEKLESLAEVINLEARNDSENGNFFERLGELYRNAANEPNGVPDLSIFDTSKPLLGRLVVITAPKEMLPNIWQLVTIERNDPILGSEKFSHIFDTQESNGTPYPFQEAQQELIKFVPKFNFKPLSVSQNKYVEEIRSPIELACGTKSERYRKTKISNGKEILVVEGRLYGSNNCIISPHFPDDVQYRGYFELN